jgi:hypothetical protein
MHLAGRQRGRPKGAVEVKLLAVVPLVPGQRMASDLRHDGNRVDVVFNKPKAFSGMLGVTVE